MPTAREACAAAHISGRGDLAVGGIEMAGDLSCAELME